MKGIVIKKQQDVHNHFKGLDYYYKPIVDGKELSFIAETEDMALIIALSYKYDGANSQFPKFAARMLGIKSEWADN